ncbi:hypothetical protein [Nocardioides pantholopis]|uniref:hypothetical protein n=1 Tax=Nocardioides pantholopis TaxID=2483798 RepID=UPI0019D1D0BE|nr:hypothetical protein [Nocardioides pantholopis]
MGTSVRNRTTAAAASVALLAAALVAGTSPPGVAGTDRPAAAGARHAEGPGFAVVRPRATPAHWAPLTPEKWDFERGQVVLTEPGTAPTGPRRPFEYAVITQGPELGSLVYRAEVRIDEAVEVTNRDVILVWNYQSPTRFYYAHLSTDNTIYPHNGIFVVDEADRRRIDDQWNGSVGADPAITDADWHDVRLVYDARRGGIAVFVDGARKPLMTATDTTFSGGRAGFGSFDNFGRVRDVLVAGVRSR